jgi:quercetin dioxygenase-like cupin family protein
MTAQTTSPAAPAAAAPAAAGELVFLGSRVRILAEGEATGGTLGVVDMLEVPAGDMPPLHVHNAEDECFYVLEGEVTFYMPGSERSVGPGEFVFAPRGIPHSYRVGDEPCHWLVVSRPAGFERFVAAVAKLETPDPERLTVVAAEHDIEILGPPGMLP